MKTNISWATHSLNFYTWDCTKVSAGCKNCYMFTMARKFGKETNGHPEWRGDAALKEYTRLKAGDVVFVNSMSDTYHENAPLLWIETIHNLIALKPEVTFLVLTKRLNRVYDASACFELSWPDNLWLGATVENKAVMEERLGLLYGTKAAHKFLSVEPLLESLMPDICKNPYLDCVDWMIVGGESGKDRRPFDKQWALEIQDICRERDIHFTFKQGGAFKPGQDYDLFGETYLDTPFTIVKETSCECA